MNFDYNSIEYRYKENIESLVDLYDKYLTERNINSSDSIKNVFVLDFHYRLQSILLLIQSFNENEEQVKILISSIHTLNRSLLENYMTFSYIFFETVKSLDLQELRLKLYLRDGYITRQNFPIRSEQIWIKNHESDLLVLLEKQIDILIEKLNIHNQKKILLKKWKPPYSELIKRIGIGKFWEQTSYSYLSAQSHSLFPGLIQVIENEREFNGHFLLRNACQYTLIISSHYLNRLISIPIHLNLKLTDKQEKVYSFYYRMSCR
ncbi:hypothetical protein B1J93_06645 [Leptospira kirschneri serovar Pomona]|uniref:Uncharacterized protein n=1 Tax=Leptospira kirschneri serovar Pomona TaxID=561005 RepID=A0A1T1DT23_9LEPT|nr:DUF5677 domain-containing protein [Leptospira kirschneri]OOV43890.1 hypothetical protein B1J93_06645 [Leptospira kirschneri serovar Pomona]